MWPRNESFSWHCTEHGSLQETALKGFFNKMAERKLVQDPPIGCSLASGQHKALLWCSRTHQDPLERGKILAEQVSGLVSVIATGAWAWVPPLFPDWGALGHGKICWQELESLFLAPSPSPIELKDSCAQRGLEEQETIPHITEMRHKQPCCLSRRIQCVGKGK